MGDALYDSIVKNNDFFRNKLLCVGKDGVYASGLASFLITLGGIHEK